MQLISFSLIFLGIPVRLVITNQNCDSSITSLCNEEKHCQNCIQAHHCCIWCFQEDFQGLRCSTLESKQLSSCDPAYIINNNETKIQGKKEAHFTDVKQDVAEAVQFNPAEYDLDLRLGEPVNLTIQYQPARNFPLDLYYLMDLTHSMKGDLLTITKLGLNLTQMLETLTKNHQIAFGSYIDKPTVPFYMTSKEEFMNPCRIEGSTCETGYLFKHRLNFTDNVTKFTEEVTKSQVSGNLDNLEGGMDALMQLLLCGSRVGWSHISRKLVLIATDGLMHLAGDGLLSGSSKRNRNKCLIDNEGNYEQPLLYDYPSLEEIHHELKTKKTNIIFAAKSNRETDSFLYYNEMNKLMPEVSFVGKLTENSTNILHLVKEGFYAFMRQVTLSVNTSSVPGLKVEFFADCDGNGKWEKTDTCKNAEEGKSIDFRVQLLLTEYQDKEMEELYVEESQIDEKVKVNVHFVGAYCNCPKTSDKVCVHGFQDCGNCTCYDGWQGEDCNERCYNDLSTCRYQTDQTIFLSCSGKGECVCSQCECSFPNGGKYCQYECPVNPQTRLICGGHGTCISNKTCPDPDTCLESECLCEEAYTGKFCECPKSQEQCKVPATDNLCNGNGDCKCNECKCYSGYSGKFCENCDQCNGLCKHYQSCVAQGIANKTEYCIIENNTVQVEFIEKNDVRQCKYIYDKEEETCEAYFEYLINKNRSVQVKVQKPTCRKPMSAGIWASIIIGAIVGVGLLAILAYKGKNMYRDRIEYERFMKNQNMASHSEQNPLYKSPVTTYNPIELVNFPQGSNT